MRAVVRATGLVKHWGATTALAGATFEVGSGVTGLLGANGAGKTTLLGLVLGLHPPDAGSIEVLGLDPTAAGPQVRERIGYVPEHEALAPDVRAHDLVRHLAEVHGLPSREATARASDALWLVGLGEERLRPVGTMSTGQRQRVKLAVALAHDPALLLLDEPTNGLDPMQREDMLDLIRRIGSELGIDVVLSSHLLEEVERTCDATVILAEGRVVASGTLEVLRSGGSGLVVDVDGRAELLAGRLRAGGLDVHVDGLRLVVDGPADVGADAVRDAAAAHRVGLRRVQARTATLEDVFLSADQGPPTPVLASQTGNRCRLQTQERVRGWAGVSDARILDRGYRRYDGPRLGVRGAVRSLAWHSALRALGLRRTFWAKLLPLASVGIAYVPALVFVGVAALLPAALTEGGGLLPDYADYYGFISAAIVLFVALVGPEVLCPDRRHRMLGLYLASPSPATATWWPRSWPWCRCWRWSRWDHRCCCSSA